MALGNSMELGHKDVHISKTEINKLHSWHHSHMCAELQEMATCGKEKESRYRETLLEILSNRWMKPIPSSINLIIKHLLGTYYFWAACSMENTIIYKTGSLSSVNSKSPEGNRHNKWTASAFTIVCMKCHKRPTSEGKTNSSGKGFPKYRWQRSWFFKWLGVYLTGHSREWAEHGRGHVHRKECALVVRTPHVWDSGQTSWKIVRDWP